MKYFFILGNNPTLSVAELSAMFGLNKNEDMRLLVSGVFTLKTDKTIAADKLIKNLGGTIKIGVIISAINKLGSEVA